jgi:hypothetical protein
MVYRADVLALSCQILNFVCELEDSPAEDAGVSAHEGVEGPEGVWACVKVEGPVTRGGEGRQR